MSDVSAQDRLEACRKSLMKNSIFFSSGLVFMLAWFTNPSIPFGIFYLGWLIMGGPRILKAIFGGFGAALKPDYEVITTYGDGRKESDSGMQSIQINLIARIISGIVFFVIGGFISIVHQTILTFKYIGLHLAASPKPPFIKSGMFIIVLNLLVFVATLIIGLAIQIVIRDIGKAKHRAELGVTTKGDFDIRKNNAGNGIIIFKYKGKGGNVIIPDTLDGLPVVGIDGSILSYEVKKKVTQLTLPKTLKYIGNGSFEGSGITSIVIPDGVIDVGARAFAACESLTSVTLPQSLLRVGNSFQNCKSLTDVIIPQGLTITYGTYYQSNPGETINIEELGYFKKSDDSSYGKADAFQGCSSLSATSKQAIKASGYNGDL